MSSWISPSTTRFLKTFFSFLAFFGHLWCVCVCVAATTAPQNGESTSFDPNKKARGGDRIRHAPSSQLLDPAPRHVDHHETDRLTGCDKWWADRALFTTCPPHELNSL